MVNVALVVTRCAIADLPNASSEPTQSAAVQKILEYFDKGCPRNKGFAEVWDRRPGNAGSRQQPQER